MFRALTCLSLALFLSSCSDTEAPAPVAQAPTCAHEGDAAASPANEVLNISAVSESPSRELAPTTGAMRSVPPAPGVTVAKTTAKQSKTARPSERDVTAAKSNAIAATAADGAHADPVPDPDARVMIVSFDGLRPDAIDAEIAPTLQGLIDGGSYNPVSLAEIPAVTLPNHTSMVTGLSILSHGVLVNSTIEGRVEHSTIFDVAQAHDVSMGFFANKGKLGYLCPEGQPDVRVITGDVDDIANECANAIRDHDLRLIFLHFGEPDGAGHSHGWMSEPYLAQVTRADAALKRILDAMDEKDVRKDTLIIVTSDHGGHGRTHGFPIPSDQHVPFILNGPGIAKGRALKNTTHPMDVAATALTQLGLPTKTAKDGHDVAEAREGYMPPETSAQDPSLILGSLCGPVPWLFFTLMFVGTRQMGRVMRRRR